MPIMDANCGADMGLQHTKMLGAGLPILVQKYLMGHPGRVKFCNSAVGANTAGGGSYETPYDTIAYAVADIALTDTILFVLPGHTESVIAADGWPVNASAAGLQVVGIGVGSRRPTITFSTATTATILMDLAAIRFFNMRFLNGIANLATMFDITAADCGLIGCHCIGDAVDSALSTVLISNAAADNVVIDGCNFESKTAGAGDQAILSTAAVDGLRILNTEIFGDYDEACIQCASAVMTNVLVQDCMLTNLLTGQHSIQFGGACTGNLVRNYYNNDMTQQTGVDPGSCRSFECFQCDAVDVSGILTPIIT